MSSDQDGSLPVLSPSSRRWRPIGTSKKSIKSHVERLAVNGEGHAVSPAKHPALVTHGGNHPIRKVTFDATRLRQSIDRSAASPPDGSLQGQCDGVDPPREILLWRSDREMASPFRPSPRKYEGGVSSPRLLIEPGPGFHRQTAQEILTGLRRTIFELSPQLATGNYEYFLPSYIGFLEESISKIEQDLNRGARLRRLGKARTAQLSDLRDAQEAFDECLRKAEQLRLTKCGKSGSEVPKLRRLEDQTRHLLQEIKNLERSLACQSNLARDDCSVHTNLNTQRRHASVFNS